MNVETSVLKRYSEGAMAKQESLCCAVDYDQDLLKLLPKEIVDKDYGCGDPSRYVREGDVVLDLGSGSGKICYMAAQLVGDRGEVIGVDMNDDMLGLARKYQDDMAEELGGDRVRFVKAYIQDLALDLESVDRYLAEHPVTDLTTLGEFRSWQMNQSIENPVIGNDSVDLVISNCVLNLVQDADKQRLLKEVFRVTKPGGRVAISDIVSDEPVPDRLKADPALWSGCISGALQEQAFAQAFVDAGFQAVALEKWDAEPWQVVEGIEFRSVTITAIKGEASECLDQGHAVIYRGPFSQVYDDDGHYYPRGKRIAVCERTFRMLTKVPYSNQFIGVAPVVPQAGKSWCSPAGTERPAKETKGGHLSGANKEASCC